MESYDPSKFLYHSHVIFLKYTITCSASAMFAFVDFVPNTSDDEGRYSIGSQANAGLFNLQKLLEALEPLLTSDQLLGLVIMSFSICINVYQTRTTSYPISIV